VQQLVRFDGVIGLVFTDHTPWLIGRCFSWHSRRRFSRHWALPGVHKPRDICS